MTTSCKSYYMDLNKKCAQVVEKLFESDLATSHAECHGYINNLRDLLICFEHSASKEVFEAALREYEYSLLAAAQGQYRQAFTALRLTLELGLGSVYFASNEFEFRQWRRAEKDLSWRKIICEQTGILSKPFARAFNQDLVEKADLYRNLCEKLYRECSEFVHGNAQTHSTIPTYLTFETTTLSEWHSKAKSVQQSLTFCVCMRYLSDLTTSQKTKIEAPVLEILGHDSAIRAYFGATTESKRG